MKTLYEILESWKKLYQGKQITETEYYKLISKELMIELFNLKIELEDYKMKVEQE